MSDSPIEALRETVQTLWPNASAVELLTNAGCRSSSRNDEPGTPRSYTPDSVASASDLRASGAEVHDLVVIPKASSPRLLVPVGRREASASMQRFSAAITKREMVERIAISSGIRLAGTRWFHDRVRVTGDMKGSLVEHLSDLLFEPVSVSIGIGTVRANRKPVLGIFGRNGKLLGYAKVGDTSVSRGHVTGEAIALKRISEHSWSVVQPPELIHFGEWNGMCLLVMSALNTRPWQGRDSLSKVPHDAMDEIAEAFDEGVMPLGDTPMWRRSTATPDELSDPDTRIQLASAIERLAERFADRPVRVGAWHGDFTPWNMARACKRVQLWDWERFETGVPVGIDRMHYCVNVRARQLRFSPASVLTGLAWAGPQLSHDSSKDAVTAVSYVLSLTCRYLLGAEGEGGDAIATKAGHMLTVLERLSNGSVA